MGKWIKRPHVEAADAPWTPIPRAPAPWRRPRHWTPGRQRERVEADSSDGAGAGGLALPGLWGAASARRPPRDEALAGGLRLRPRAPRGPLSLVPRSDGRALRAGAPGGERLGRRPVYVRGRAPSREWVRSRSRRWPRRANLTLPKMTVT